MKLFEHLEKTKKKVIKSKNSKIKENLDFRKISRRVYQQLTSEQQKLFDAIKMKTHPQNLNWEICVLGTASMMPSTLRNVSAIMLTLNKRTRILFDCGEGTLSQIYLKYGIFTEQVLIDLDMILISHLHGDHFFGIFKVLDERQRVLDKYQIKNRPCHLILPRNSISFFLNYTRFIKSLDVNVICINDLRSSNNDLFNYDYNDQVTFKEMKENDDFVKKVNPNEKKSLRYKNPEEEESLKNFYKYFPVSDSLNKLINLCNEIQFQKILFPRVMHCPDSFGIVIQASSEEKFVYSGDCRPSLELIRAGNKASILIHESTFEDGPEMNTMAKLKQHTTISEALQVGLNMQAEYLILTHFSQRYCFTNYVIKSNEKNKEKFIHVNKSEKEILKYFLEKSILASDFICINPINAQFMSLFNFILNRPFLGCVTDYTSKVENDN
jgi:ribonuclease Z